MIIFSLDEQGDFEGLDKTNNDPIMIGGIVFYDNDVDRDKKEKKGEQEKTVNLSEAEREKRRIVAYYKAVCEEYSSEKYKLRYPKSFHVGNGVSEAIVRQAKIGVSETIGEFIQYGTFKGEKLKDVNNDEFPDRRGCYYPYVYVKSECGKSEYFTNIESSIHENAASNLYYHMAHSVLRRMIFQNHVAPNEKQYILDIATRSSAIMSVKDPKRDEYINAGYKLTESDENAEAVTGKNGKLKYPNLQIEVTDESGKKVKENAFRVQLTNKDVYRTACADLVIQYQRFDCDFETHVKSITYKGDGKNQQFLYLADSVCSVVSFKLKGKTERERFVELRERAENIFGSESVVLFAYDIVDDCYSKAYDFIQNGDYYSAFEQMYKGRKDNVYAKYYEEKYYPILEKMMLDQKDIASFENAVIKLERSQRTNAYHAELSMYIMSGLFRLVDKIKEQQNTVGYNRVFFTLYNAAVTAYSHAGNPKMAKECYSKCLEYSYFTNTEEFLRLRNKMVGFLTDNFEFESALRISEKNIIYQDELAAMKKNIVEMIQPDSSIERCKAYSQVGQVYAFMSDKRAEEFFTDALMEINNKTPDYFITESYLLHFCIDQRDEKTYDRWAREYFGENTDIEKQFDYIVEQGKKKDPIFKLSYATYLFLKALYYFKKDYLTTEAGKSLWEKLTNLKKIVKEDSFFHDHPIEFICKYIMLLNDELFHDEKVHRRYRRILDNCLYSKGDLLHCIFLYGEVELAIASGERDLANDHINELFDIFNEKFETDCIYTKAASTEAKWKFLQSKLTYMYR